MTKNEKLKTKVTNPKQKRKKKKTWFFKKLPNWKWLLCLLCSTSYTNKKGKEVPSKGGKLKGQTCKQQGKQVCGETSRSKW